MSILSLFALVFGTLGVWLTIKQTIYCWPISIIALSASGVEFYSQHLYGDMTLQLFYLVISIYGWILWRVNNPKQFKPNKIKINYVFILLIVTLFQTLAYYFLLIYFNGDWPLFDALLSACSLSATFMMTKKWIENWVCWIFIDLGYMGLYGVKNMWPFVILYFLFTVMAFYGWMKWKKIK